MKVYILVDENRIVRCVTSEECNLHRDKLTMEKYHVERNGTVGDEYNAKTRTWTAKPENYPQPTQEELDEAKIQAKIRQMAIDKLKAEGAL